MPNGMNLFGVSAEEQEHSEEKGGHGQNLRTKEQKWIQVHKMSRTYPEIIYCSSLARKAIKDKLGPELVLD